MAWYKAGTVALTNGSTTVTGTNTAFAANSRVGDAFIGPNGALHEVTNIASATVLSISPAYAGATTSAGAYALAPIQGYVKQLADNAATIIQQWGETLAGLGTVSTENVVPVTKGGTGGTTQAAARTGLGLKAAAVADILGTVAFTSGAPSGAIVERGTNANGTYEKYAGGFMICYSPALTMPAITEPAGALYGALNEGVAWTFPAAFAETPRVHGQDQSYNVWVIPGGVLGSSCRLKSLFTASLAGTRTVLAVAVGRWSV